MKESKKILIVTSEFPPQPGGIGNHAWNLAHQLSQHGKDVVVLTNCRSRDGKTECDFDQKQGFKIVRVVRKNPIIFTYFNRLTAYKKIVTVEKPDVILASGKFSLWLVGLFFINSYSKKIAIVHGSEVNLPRKWEKYLVNKSLKRMHRIIAVSNYTKQLLSALNTLIVVIPNGFNVNDFKKDDLKRAATSKNLNLVTVGALTERKGQHNVISALPFLKKSYPNIHYHMVGIPMDKDKLKRLAIDLQVYDMITIHGVKNQRDLVKIVLDCDIFVMLSNKTPKGEVEGFGIALLEANYLGLPSIGTFNCGIEDAIDNYKSGILVPLHDNKALEEAIKELLSNRGKYQKEAKKWALKHQWDVIITKYLKVLES